MALADSPSAPWHRKQEPPMIFLARASSSLPCAVPAPARASKARATRPRQICCVRMKDIFFARVMKKGALGAPG